MITKETIAHALQQYKRRVIAENEYPSYRRAAVLIPLFPKDGELSVLLTLRTDEVETHKGQISCPGGMWDDGDGTLTQTALRETEEELGIPQKRISILGQSDDQATPTKFIITPVVGYLPELPPLRINKKEVSEAFDVPLSIFVERRHASTQKHVHGGKQYNVWYIQFGKRLIWGATAMLLVNFAEIISGRKQQER